MAETKARTKRELRPATSRPIRELSGLPRELMHLQAAVKDATASARRDQEARGKMLKVRFPGSPGGTQTQPFSVNHGLGRKPQGADVKKAPNAVLYTIASMTTRVINFTSGGGSGSLELWVY